MIKSFKSKESEEIFQQRSDRLPADVQQAALYALRMLDHARTPRDFGILPRDDSKEFSGGGPVLYNIPVNNECRLCFEWREGDAYNVEIVTDLRLRYGL
jgi:proteic killer suppression protein